MLSWDSSPRLGRQAGGVRRSAPGSLEYDPLAFHRCLRELLRDPAPAAVRGPILALLESYDPDLAGHSLRTALYARFLGKRLGWTPGRLAQLELGAYLHDLGKLAVPRGVLAKAGPLTASERELVRRHPLFGLDLLEGAPLPGTVLDVIAHHHERWDGEGYPSRLAGARIPLAARLLAVADTFDALTSHRPHRAAVSTGEALAELLRSAGSQLDPGLLPAVFAALEEFGTVVRGGRP